MWVIFELYYILVNNRVWVCVYGLDGMNIFKKVWYEVVEIIEKIIWIFYLK